MFQGNTDLYDFIRLLIRRLEELGIDEWRRAFEDSLYIGGTSGETLGAIRKKLIEFRETEVEQVIGLSDEIRLAIEAIDAAFGRRST